MVVARASSARRTGVRFPPAPPHVLAHSPPGQIHGPLRASSGGPIQAKPGQTRPNQAKFSPLLAQAATRCENLPGVGLVRGLRPVGCRLTRVRVAGSGLIARTRLIPRTRLIRRTRLIGRRGLIRRTRLISRRGLIGPAHRPGSSPNPAHRPAGSSAEPGSSAGASSTRRSSPRMVCSSSGPSSPSGAESSPGSPASTGPSGWGPRPA